MFQPAFFKHAPRVDIFCAGHPCQPFSNQGSRRGSEDVRATVIEPILAYISVKRPTCFFLENVPGWLTTAGTASFECVLGVLRGLRSSDGNHLYNVSWAKLKTSDFSIPQNRTRVYVVGVQACKDRGFAFPKGTGLSVRNATSRLLEFESLLDTPTSESMPAEVGLDAFSKTGRNNVDTAIKHFRQKGQDPFAQHIIVDLNGHGSKSWTEVCFPTLTASRCRSQAYFNLRLGRRHSLSELARAQGADTQRLNMDIVPPPAMGSIIGNAMSINIVVALMRELLRAAGLA